MADYSENKYINTDTGDSPEKIDIVGVLQEFLAAFKRLWWIVVALVIVLSAVSYFRTTSTYTPQYVASASVSVNGGSTDGTENAMELADIFPYLQSSGAINEALMNHLGVDHIDGNISMTADSDMNLLVISVSSDDPQNSYEILQAVIETYPSVAEFITGNLSLVVLDETGIPSDNRRTQVIRGSYRNGALAGLIIGLAIIAIYAFANHTVRSKKEIDRQINLTDLGSLPGVETKKRKKENRNAVSLLNERLPQSYMEAIRKIRIKILSAIEEKGYKTIVVTSSIPGEGKTTISTNIAISLAQHGKKVLLVDCDVRNPSVGGVLADAASDNKFGLLPLLDPVPVDLEDVLIDVKLPGSVKVGEGSLTAIYGGKGDPDGAEVLGSERMKKLLNIFRKNYDVVILDTAPSELLSDASLLAGYADAAVYVVRYEHTKPREIRSGVEALADSGVDILGYIFNGDKSAKSRWLRICI